MDSLKRLDVDKAIGQVTLTDGETKLNIPRISMSKIIKIVKFLGIDGTKMYEDSREVLTDQSLDDMSKVALVLENLEEEQLIRIFSILLDVDDQTALALDFNEMLDVILVYVEETNITKTFSQVRQLYKKMFNRELPDLGAWFQEKAEQQKEMQRKREEAEAQTPEPEPSPKNNPPEKAGTS